jgi:hypothetical protein
VSGRGRQRGDCIGDHVGVLLVRITSCTDGQRAGAGHRSLLDDVAELVGQQA